MLFLQHQLDQICEGERRLLIEVCTLDHVAIEMSGYQDTLLRQGVPRARATSSARAREATQQVRQGRGRRSPYDAIVVDEAQDLDSVRVAFVQALSGKCRDSASCSSATCASASTASPSTWRTAAFDVTGRVFHLDTVYRVHQADRRTWRGDHGHGRCRDATRPVEGSVPRATPTAAPACCSCRRADEADELDLALPCAILSAAAHGGAHRTASPCLARTQAARSVRSSRCSAAVGLRPSDGHPACS